MVRRTRDEAAETRNRILDAAERVFSERGVSHTSLEDIAKAAGVTRGAIYWHFKNKSELFTAMVNRVTLPMEEMVARSGEDDAANPLALLKDGRRQRAQAHGDRSAVPARLRRRHAQVRVPRRHGRREASASASIQCGCVERTEKAIATRSSAGLLPTTSRRRASRRSGSTR